MSAALASTRFQHNERDNVRVPKLQRLVDHLVEIENSPVGLVEFPMFIEASPGDGVRLMRYTSRRGLTLEEGQTVLDAEDAATAEAVFTLKKDGVTVGTITVPAAGTAGVVSITDPDLPALAILEIFAPSPQDATLADISITLGASRVSSTNGLVELSSYVDARPDAGERLIRYVSKRDLVLFAAATILDAEDAATASSVFTLKKDGVSIGTITVAAAGTAGTVSISDVDLPADSVLELFAPAAQDATLGDVTITIAAIR